MSKARRPRLPKLEPELLECDQGVGSVGGAALSPHESGRVSGASVSQSVAVASGAPITVALCDGSMFTFTRLADVPTVADA